MQETGGQIGFPVSFRYRTEMLNQIGFYMMERSCHERDLS